jgi:hypothetical protein
MRLPCHKDWAAGSETGLALTGSRRPLATPAPAKQRIRARSSGVLTMLEQPAASAADNVRTT